MAKILVIDDDTMVTQLLDEFLKGEGHDVAITHTGNEGFQKALDFSPELILQDVMLPDSTGFQMVDRFRAEPATATVPIIMMSGAARHPNQKQLGNMMGANDYVLKPFEIDDIDARIKRLLSGQSALPSRDETTPTPAQTSAYFSPSPTPTYQAPAPSYTSPTPSNPINDWNSETDSAPQSNDSSPATYSRTPPSSGSTTAYVSPSSKMPTLWSTGIILITHLSLAIFAATQHEATWRAIFSAARAVVGGWSFLLGAMMGTSAILKITLEARPAIRRLGWAMLPAVVHFGLRTFSLKAILEALPFQNLAGTPMDFFEWVTILILGLVLRWRPGGSIAKAAFSVLVLGVLWIMVGRSIMLPPIR